MESNSEEFRVHCSEAAARLVAEQDPAIKLCPRGEIPIKGKGTMSTYWVVGISGPANGTGPKSSGLNVAAAAGETAVATDDEAELAVSAAAAAEANVAEGAGEVAAAPGPAGGGWADAGGNGHRQGEGSESPGTHVAVSAGFPMAPFFLLAANGYD